MDLGIYKIRKGLKLLIEGIIEDNLENKDDLDIPEVRRIVGMHNEEIAEYLRIAKDRYNLSEEELHPLKIKYATMKTSLNLT